MSECGHGDGVGVKQDITQAYYNEEEIIPYRKFPPFHKIMSLESWEFFGESAAVRGLIRGSFRISKRRRVRNLCVRRNSTPPENVDTYGPTLQNLQMEIIEGHLKWAIFDQILGVTSIKSIKSDTQSGFFVVQTKVQAHCLNFSYNQIYSEDPFCTLKSRKSCKKGSMQKNGQSRIQVKTHCFQIKFQIARVVIIIM